MPALGSGSPTIQRGKQCKRGHDEWRVAKAGHYQCAPCDRAKSRAYQRQRNDLLPFEKMWRKARERALNGQVPFLLTVADIEACWPKDGLCPVLKIPLVRGVGFTIDGSPTLDRLSGESGYEPGNIAIISHRANRAKGDMSAAELARIAFWMRHEHGLD